MVSSTQVTPNFAGFDAEKDLGCQRVYKWTMSITTLSVSAAIGFASGLRSTMGIAAFAHAKFDGTPNAALAHQFSGLAIVAESIGDKLPKTPSRLQMPGLLARVAAGGLGAYGLARTKEPAAAALAIGTGSAAALVGSYAGAAYRGAAATKVPPLAAAVAEDLAANALAYVTITHSTK